MRRVVLYPALGFFTLLGLACLGLSFPFEILLSITAGWAYFLARVVPGVTVDPGGVTIAVACLALFAILAHSFFGWLHRQIRGEEGPGGSPRWTASLVAGVVLMFAAGISAAGVAHQAGWLLSSPEGWVKTSGGHRVSRRMQSASNLRQIGLGLAVYESTHGALPPGTSLDDEGRLLHGWQARIFPYIDNIDLYDAIDFAVPWDDPKNAAAFRTGIGIFRVPGVVTERDEQAPAPSHYAGNVRVLGGDVPRKSAGITDGTARTILAGEAAGEFKPWGHPANYRDPARGINRGPGGFGGPAPGGANFLFADGSVHFLKDRIDPKVLRALSTPAGGDEINSLDDFD